MHTTNYGDFEIVVKGDLVTGSEALVLFKDGDLITDYQVGQIRDVIYGGVDFQKFSADVDAYLANKAALDTIATGEIMTDNGPVYVGVIATGDDPYNKTLYITRRESEIIHKYLTVEPTCEEECLGEDETISREVVFPDGVRMSIDVCGVQYREGEPTNTAWTQAVLFSKEGSQLTHTDVCEDYLGTWELEYGGRIYSVTVKEAAERQYNTRIRITPQQYTAYQRLLNDEPSCEEECLGDFKTEFLSYTFPDGKYATLAISGEPYNAGDSNLSKAKVTLFSKERDVLAEAKPVGHGENELRGDWQAAYGNATYRVTVVVEEALG